MLGYGRSSPRAFARPGQLGKRGQRKEQRRTQRRLLRTPRLPSRGFCVRVRGSRQKPHRRFRKHAVMPVGDTGDAILRHSALGQRQKPHDPKRARNCGPSDGQSLPHLIPMSHAGRSSRTVLTNFSIETGFARNLSGQAYRPHCGHENRRSRQAASKAKTLAPMAKRSERLAWSAGDGATMPSAASLHIIQHRPSPGTLTELVPPVLGYERAFR